jgi:hypothetical protein
MKHMIFRMVILCALLARGMVSAAQEVTLVDEQDIGTDCPVTSAVQPGTDVMWVLMDNCGGRRFSLRGYDLSSGDWAGAAPIPLEAIDSERYEVYGFTAPMGFTPDGALQIMAANRDDDNFTRFVVDVQSGAVTSDDAEELNALLRQYSEYPAFATTFSGDFRYAAVNDDVKFHVLDLAAQEALFEVDTPASAVTFSADSTRLYMSILDEPDNYDNFDAAIVVYSLPDGAELDRMAFPFSVLYPSDDGHTIAVQVAAHEVGSEQLGVVDLETGSVSGLLPISVPPRRATKCHNTGRDISDLDLTASGRLYIRGLAWLPGNSGFITINAYDGTQTNTGCIFEYSRARRYGVGG